MSTYEMEAMLEMFAGSIGSFIGRWWQRFFPVSS